MNPVRQWRVELLITESGPYNADVMRSIITWELQRAASAPGMVVHIRELELLSEESG